MKNSLLLIILLGLFSLNVFPQTTGEKTALDRAADLMKEAADKTKEGASDAVIANEFVTYKNFESIRLGMLYEDLKAMFKAEGELVEDEDNHKEYYWEGKDGLTLWVELRDGLVFSKTLSGFSRKDESLRLTSDQYRLIQKEMSYEAITGILGTLGKLTKLEKRNGNLLAEYVWIDADANKMHADFIDNKLRFAIEEGIIQKSKVNVPEVWSADVEKKTEAGIVPLSLAQFDRIELGMSYEDVKAIIGSDGKENASSKDGEDEIKGYQWKGEKFASIRVIFRNGQLHSKSQTNIGPRNGTADLTPDKFNQIHMGMSYAQVMAILGSLGEMTRISKIGDKTLTAYVWKGPNYQRIFTNFKNDKLQNKSQSGLE